MEELYIKYALKIYKYIYALCGNHDVTEDILQETFYSAIKNIKQFKNNSSIYTWLCTIARNKWNDYLRKNKKIQFISLEDDINSNISVEKEIETKEEMQKLYQIIKKLDEITQEVIKLRIISEFSFREIGEMFGKSEQWAKNIFYRGRLKIKEKFKYGSERM